MIMHFAEPSMPIPVCSLHDRVKDGRGSSHVCKKLKVVEYCVENVICVANVIFSKKLTRRYFLFVFVKKEDIEKSNNHLS